MSRAASTVLASRKERESKVMMRTTHALAMSFMMMFLLSSSLYFNENFLSKACHDTERGGRRRSSDFSEKIFIHFFLFHLDSQTASASFIVNVHFFLVFSISSSSIHIYICTCEIYISLLSCAAACCCFIIID